MLVSFSKIRKGSTYSRNELARLWECSTFHAIARGVVTPKHDNKIVLFVTEKKQESAEQYKDRLSGRTLQWEGPRDHFAEERMIHADSSGDEIHLFHRARHHEDFIYCGRLRVNAYKPLLDRSSRFTFQLF
jgi:hypothetical protein